MVRLRDFNPDILAFPEYFFVGSNFDSVAASCVISDEILFRLKQWSSELNCVIVGGSLVEKEGDKIFNRSYLIERGNIIGHYDKIHLFRDEGKGLVLPGTEYRVFEIESAKIGLLICADVLYPDTFRNIRGLGPNIIIIPTTSPFRFGESVENKFARDQEIFGVGADLANAILVKISASGSIIGHRLQGRSLIASPGRVEWRIEPEHEDQPALVTAVLGPDIRNPLLDIAVYRS
jgi:predicted amidohydrolase